jgi:threonine dehydrogenase-like Zn-dependent dehydrogenase
MTDLVRSRGWIVNVGVFKSPPALDMRAVNFKELTVVGSRVYTRDDFRQAIEIAPALLLADVVSHRFPLRDIHSALAAIAAQDRVSKVLIEPEGRLA